MKLPHDLPTTAGETVHRSRSRHRGRDSANHRGGLGAGVQLPGCQRRRGEVELNERLRDGMRAALDPGELPWGGTLIVQAGAESRSGPHILRPDGRTDIPILSIEIFVRY